MNDQMLRDLLRRVSVLERNQVRLRVGEVTGTAPLDVALGGSDVSYDDVRSVQPVGSGDQVAALTAGHDLIVLGPVADGVQPHARVYNNADQSIPNNAITALTFNTERFDVGAMHSTSLDTSRLTAPVAGLYALGGGLQWAAPGAPAGERILIVRVGGSTEIARVQVQDAAGTEIQAVSTLWRFAAGDYAELCGYQNSGGALNAVTTSAYSPEFWMVRVGP
jgi:hypothetical protein